MHGHLARTSHNFRSPQPKQSSFATGLDWVSRLLAPRNGYGLFRCKKTIKKNYIFLEILIGLTLASLLFTLLFRSISHVAQLEKKVEKVRITLLKREHTQVRLQEVFFSLSPRKPFYTKEGALFGAFDQGIDPDADFSGEVSFTLKLDEKQHLALTIYSLQDPTKWRKEILFSNATGTEFLFFGKEKDSKSLFAWYKSWSQETKDLPLMIQCNIFEGKQEISFGFSLPHRQTPTFKRRSLV